MAVYEIPKDSKKFCVMVAQGGTWAVWNGKNGEKDFSILVRTRKQAEELCAKLNRRDRPKTITV